MVLLYISFFGSFFLRRFVDRGEKSGGHVGVLIF